MKRYNEEGDEIFVQYVENYLMAEFQYFKSKECRVWGLTSDMDRPYFIRFFDVGGYKVHFCLEYKLEKVCVWVSRLGDGRDRTETREFTFSEFEYLVKQNKFFDELFRYEPEKFYREGL